MPLPIDKAYLLAQLRNFKTIILDPDFKIQKTELPTASEDNEGAVFQYVGTDTTNYTIGGFYQCQEVTPATNPPTYHWVAVSKDFDDNFVGTLAQWNALSVAEKKKYKTADITDDFNGAPIDSALSDTSTNPVQNKVVKAALDHIGEYTAESLTDVKGTIEAGGLYKIGSVHVLNLRLRTTENLAQGDVLAKLPFSTPSYATIQWSCANYNIDTFSNVIRVNSNSIPAGTLLIISGVCVA